ncbi:MAG TPA: winged helix-turn-helix domain-containing protein, partial [Terriglobales bacterium]|nr:winged helix-turn-helix domain-containing protein [Terriglobales bacterium]
MQGTGETERSHGSRVRFGSFEADLNSGELFRKGSRVRIQEKPFRLLAILLQHPGDMVSREDLHRALWPEDTFVDFDVGLNTAIRKLRAALQEDTDRPRYIETVPRRGYRLIARTDIAPQRHSRKIDSLA